MRLVLDGRRLTTVQMRGLLEACHFAEVSDALLAQGYRLCVVRAPRKFPKDGILRVRFAYTLRDAAGYALTVRLNGTVGVDPA